MNWRQPWVDQRRVNNKCQTTIIATVRFGQASDLHRKCATGNSWPVSAAALPSHAMERGSGQAALRPGGGPAGLPAPGGDPGRGDDSAPFEILSPKHSDVCKQQEG